MNNCFLLPERYGNDKTYSFQLDDSEYVYYNVSQFPNADTSFIDRVGYNRTRHEGIYILYNDNLPSPEEVLLLMTGVQEVEEEEASNELEIIAQSFRGNHRTRIFDIIRQVFTEELPDVKEVFYDEPRSNVSNPTRSGTWCIKMWANPVLSNLSSIPSIVVDEIRLDTFSDGVYEYIESDESNPIILSGTVVGQVVRETIYFHYNATQHVEYLSVIDSVLREGIAVHNGKRYDMREIFIKQLSVMANKQLNDNKRQLETVVAQINEHAGELTRLYRTRVETMTYIDNFDEEYVGSMLLEQLELIEANKNIKSLKISMNNLTFFTEMMFIRVKEKTYEIGEFEVTVNIESGNVVFKNLTRRVNSGYDRDMHAPHVFPTGNACFGNIQQGVSQLIGELQLAAVADLLCAFLSSVNTGDAAGKYYYKWPEVTVKEEEDEN